MIHGGQRENPEYDRRDYKPYIKVNNGTDSAKPFAVMVAAIAHPLGMGEISGEIWFELRRNVQKTHDAAHYLYCLTLTDLDCDERAQRTHERGTDAGYRIQFINTFEASVSITPRNNAGG